MGLNEVIGRLINRGFAVATLDWRGQGGSERALSDPRKGHVGDFSEYERDVEALMNEVVLPDCPPPYYALAHSMGGAVMLRLAHAGKRWFDRMVLLAPMIALPGVRQSPVTQVVVRGMRWLGLGGSYVPGGDASVNRAPSTATCWPRASVIGPVGFQVPLAGSNIYSSMAMRLSMRASAAR